MTELCDGKDSDCDGDIDEGPIVLEESFPLRFRCHRFEGYTWMGLFFYLEHPSFFFWEIYCFFIGHKMKRHEIVEKYGFAGPVGEYACECCGQMIDVAMGPEELRRYAKHGYIRKRDDDCGDGNDEEGNAKITGDMNNA